MIIKRSIVTTFTSCFLINLGALIALVSLLNINLFDFKTTWVILTVSAMLNLLYIVFFWIQYDEQKKGLTQDIEKILNNETPDYEQLQALAKRQEEMSSELQTLSVAKNAEQEAIIESERIRISRELHDSVSQELFAATMILSSVVDNPSLTTKQITSQTTLTLKILHEAQDEMRSEEHTSELQSPKDL